MRLFQGIRRPFGGFQYDPHPRDVEKARNKRDDELAEAVQRINFYLGALYRRTEKIMRTMDEVLQLVYAQRGQINSLAALTSGIKQRLDEVIGGALPPSVQAEVDKIFDELNANTAAINKAVRANNDDPTDDDPAPVEPAPAPVDQDPRLPPL